MKKRNFLVMIAALGLVSFGHTVLAEDTTGEVEFTAGTIVFDPDEGGADPTAQLPKDLDFGSHVIQTTAAETWYATTDGTGVKAGGNLQRGTIAVSDNRGNPTSEWAVKVKQVEQFKIGTETLGNAQLNFKVGSLTNNISNPPTSNISGGQLIFAIFNQDYAVLTAGPGTGAGETKLPIEEFELMIPANTKKVANTYQTTVVWTFTDGPTGP